MREIANTILPGSIIMKEDTCSKHPSKKVPMLDTEMWVEDGQIRHRHYSKPMSSREVILQRSSIPTSAKRDILVQEGCRRLRNSDMMTVWEEKIKPVNELMLAMKEGGHVEAFRETVSKRIVAKYEANIKRWKEEGRPMYRSKEEREIQTEREGRKTKSNWFKSDGITATVTIPATKDGVLKDIINKVIMKAPGPKYTGTKILERPGKPIMNCLTTKKILKRPNCGRKECPLTWKEEGCREECFKESITYQARCQLCIERQRREGVTEEEMEETVYEGETSRSLYSRYQGHMTKYKEQVEKEMKESRGEKEKELEEDEKTNFMWEHLKDCHPESIDQDNPKDLDLPKRVFQFRVTGSFRDPLTRKLTEMIRIRMALYRGRIGGERSTKNQVIIKECLNSKEESFTPTQKTARWRKRKEK